MRFNLYDLNEFVSKNGSTCHDMYYELVYFELIVGETCQQESDKIINRVKENQTNLAQTYLYIILTSKKKCYIFIWFAPIMSIIVNLSYNMTMFPKE